MAQGQDPEAAGGRHRRVHRAARRRQDFGALVLGVYDGQELVYIGHTGGGFDDRQADRFARSVRPRSAGLPVRDAPKTNAPVHWVEPQLVCEVSFQEWTADGVMRQPIFLGLREDKPARAVRREKRRSTSR